MKLLLITGEMRSGTTFVANLLNSQSGITCYADFLLPLFRDAQKMSIVDINQELTDQQINVLRSSIIAEATNQSKNLNSLKQNKFKTWIDLFYIISNLLIEKNSKIFGIKVTRQELYNQQLLKQGIKIVYCYRDPRAVIYSSINRFAEYNLLNGISNWKKSIKIALDLDKHPGFYLLSYEKLMLDKEKELTRLSKFLNIEIASDINILKDSMNNQYSDNSSFTDINKLFDTRGVYRWKNKLDPISIIQIEAVLKNEIKHLGYELTCSDNIALEKALNKFRKIESKRKFKEKIKKIISGFSS